MGPQIKLLKDHRQIGANADDLRFVGGMAVVPGAAPQDRLSFEKNFALLAVFQQVCAAQQGRFA